MARYEMVTLLLVLLASSVAAKVEEHNDLLKQFKAIKKIDPKLRPESDKKFFGKPGKPGDYPTDTGRGIKDHFDFPFPTVQDSEDYDKDLVKDENADGGEWKAHEVYDRLRGKLHKETAEKEAAQTKVAEAQKKYDAAKTKSEAAKEAAAEHEKEVEEAKKKEKKAEEELAKVGAASGQGSGKKDEAEVNDLEDCKAKLQAARERLKKLLDEREKKKAEKAAAEQDVEEAEAASVEAEKVDADLKQTLDQEQKDHKLAEAKYKEEKAEYDAAQAKLDKAAEKLRAHRSDDVDQNQGVYFKDAKRATESGAMSAGPLLLVAMAALASAATA